MTHRICSILVASVLCNSLLLLAAPPKKNSRATNNFKDACLTAKAQTDLDINNVRARLLTGGDLWWDRSDGKYVVPKPAPGQPEVSAIFAAGIWLGGIDNGGNLKVACQQYGNSQGNSDFWPGPLTVDEGTTDATTCNLWDRHFEANGIDIKEHLTRWSLAENGQKTYIAADIPTSVKGWPGRGNPFFEEIHGFSLPNNTYGLADFFDRNQDLVYDPLDGDFPYLEKRCNEGPTQYPDQMVFWIFNDEGGGAFHGETNGTPIRMEVHATAFAYSTTDAINDMTFYQHKFINRATEDIDSFYFALWVAPDLGCYLDDYIGCDPNRNLAYYYNADAEDGQPGTSCNGVSTYEYNIPALGIDFFRGPRDENGNELKMSSFTYYITQVGIGFPSPLDAPSSDVEFYRYLTGSFKDGTHLSYGNYGYDPTNSNLTNFAFPNVPNDPVGWSMCYPGSGFPSGLSPHYRSTIQSFGPILLQPGARELLTFGVVFAPNIDYPCPDLTRLFAADDLAQAFFDCNLHDGYGPNAPDVDWIAGDEEITLILSNGEDSNNKDEGFMEYVPEALKESQDQTYNFEGYLVYQMAGPDANFYDLDDTSKARLVFQCDIENELATVTNWRAEKNPNYQSAPGIEQFVHFPEEQIHGENKGIQRTIPIRENLFAKGSDRRLINHCTYYYLVVAYAANNYLPFDPVTGVGQRKMFVIGSGNVGAPRIGPSYPIMPRPAQNGLLDKVQVVPNPYYFFNGYADEKSNGYLKITNLPPQCEVDIYSLNGNLVRHFSRNEQPQPPFGSGVEALQAYPDLNWDLTNTDGTTIASGVYILHIRTKGAGERTLKAVII